jgi:NADPH-dependent glutamate synthase beta subunit-like oxidoreductase
VESFLQDGVKFVGVVGVDASLVEDIIDEIVVGDGADPNRFILTSGHENESVEEALDFARNLTGEYAGEVQLVEV